MVQQNDSTSESTLNNSHRKAVFSARDICRAIDQAIGLGQAFEKVDVAMTVDWLDLTGEQEEILRQHVADGCYFSWEWCDSARNPENLANGCHQ